MNVQERDFVLCFFTYDLHVTLNCTKLYVCFLRLVLCIWVCISLYGAMGWMRRAVCGRLIVISFCLPDVLSRNNKLSGALHCGVLQNRDRHYGFRFSKYYCTVLLKGTFFFVFNSMIAICQWSLNAHDLVRKRIAEMSQFVSYCEMSPHLNMLSTHLWEILPSVML